MIRFVKVSFTAIAALAAGALPACGTDLQSGGDDPANKIKDYAERVQKDKKPDVKAELKRFCANPT